MSSRHFATAAISARAESFTADGAMPSAQLIVLSAVALLAAVCDHFQTGIDVLGLFGGLAALQDVGECIAFGNEARAALAGVDLGAAFHAGAEAVEHAARRLLQQRARLLVGH